MVSFPHCKINLGLRVIDKRPDGFHNIETCFYPVPWTDVLEVIPAPSFSFANTGIAVGGKEESNLCVRAYRMLQNDFKLPPVAMHLHKIVPMGAGLGGGSSDAAYTLNMLNHIFALGLQADELRHFAAQLGSDCAFFIDKKAMIGTGRGELLEEADVSLEGKFLVIVKPDIQIPTAEAYQHVVPNNQHDRICKIVEGQHLENWRHTLVNDFEATVFERHPPIKEIKEVLYAKDALYAAMSGSGSSVFGIFKSAVDLKQLFDKHTYWSGML